MLGAGIHMQAPENLAANDVFWQHPTDGMLHQASRVFATDHLRCLLALPARVARIGEDQFVVELLAGHSYFVGIDHYYMIAHVHVWGVGWFMLSAQNAGNLTGHATQHLVFGIYQYPTLFCCCVVGIYCFITVMIHFISF